MGLVYVIYLMLQWHIEVSEELNCAISTYFSAWSNVLRKIQNDSVTFLRLCSSVSLECKFSFKDLKYSSKFKTTKSLTSSFVKIFKQSSILRLYNIMLVIRIKVLPD